MWISKYLRTIFLSLFDWGLFPNAESFLRAQLNDLLSSNHLAGQQAVEIQQNTSTNIFDWVDHLIVPADKVNTEELAKMGFEESNRSFDDVTVFRVQGSTIFPLILKKGKAAEVALSVEEIEDFRRIYGKEKRIQGLPNSNFRKLTIASENDFALSILERRGSSGYMVEDTGDVDSYVEALKVLASRERRFTSEEEGVLETERLLKTFGSKLSKQRLADAFFRAERRYWESRNRAGKVQKGRQDKVGGGWGNVDHHTFRSSRRNFAVLIRIFEYLGLQPRERFHAGAQAGWGAQILEDSDGRNVVFADVDLSAEEKEVDFAHRGLEPREELGTVGLWVGLHGESILEAGMHHLAARFRFDSLREDLKVVGVGMMKPFSNFPFLKQAFTEPEKWRVKSEKLTALLNNHNLSGEQALKFVREEAVASHLEDIQRGQGFKGFNQNSFSAIIKWANPLDQEKKYA
jgi:hypothetical protein